MIHQLKQIFGERCSGIKINEPSMNRFFFPERQYNFCEAVNESFTQPLELTRANVGCSGARRSLGFDSESDELVQKVTANTGIPASFVLEAFRNMPVINMRVDNVLLGINEKLESELAPDVIIIYTNPEKVMKLMHNMARKELKPHIPPYSIHSICGNVFARAYRDDEVTVSFGCPESRKYGGVGENEVIVGIPSGKAGQIVETFS